MLNQLLASWLEDQFFCLHSFCGNDKVLLPLLSKGLWHAVVLPPTVLYIMQHALCSEIIAGLMSLKQANHSLQHCWNATDEWKSLLFVST